MRGKKKLKKIEKMKKNGNGNISNHMHDQQHRIRIGFDHKSESTSTLLL